MDQERFDPLARGFAAATSRRGTVRGLGLGLAASVIGLTRTGAVQIKTVRLAPCGCR